MDLHGKCLGRSEVGTYKASLFPKERSKAVERSM